MSGPGMSTHGQPADRDAPTREWHDGALYGIRHPGPPAGCPYCTDTLRQAGIATLADAYAAGLAARVISPASTVEVADEPH